MSSRAESMPRKATKLTLDSLHAELLDLRARVEDLEDLRELNAAIVRNKGKKLIPWTTAKKGSGLRKKWGRSVEVECWRRANRDKPSDAHL